MKSDQLKKLWMLAFGDSEDFVSLFFSTAYSPERCRFLEEKGEVSAALYWLDGECYGRKYAYIYGVATHPGCRGKGLCRKLMQMTHEDLKNEGYAGALLMPAQPGLRQMYAKMGYRECSTLQEFSREAGEKAVSLRSVSREEYAVLRRRYLPEGGLIQEGENLAYLATFAGLYAGDAFVMAAVHEQDRLFALELLGEPNAAPGILKAMGYGEGTFRVPGEGMPFSMYCPLQPEAPMPTYLGLAFD